MVSIKNLKIILKTDENAMTLSAFKYKKKNLSTSSQSTVTTERHKNTIIPSDGLH